MNQVPLFGVQDSLHGLRKLRVRPHRWAFLHGRQRHRGGVAQLHRRRAPRPGKLTLTYVKRVDAGCFSDAGFSASVSNFTAVSFFPTPFNNSTAWDNSASSTSLRVSNAVLLVGLFAGVLWLFLLLLLLFCFAFNHRVRGSS